MNRLVMGMMITVAASVLASGAARADDPLMGKSPWNFDPVNRAGVAVAMKNVEDGGSGSGSGTTIVCGGTSGGSGHGATGAGSSATGNSSCIIVNNSDGNIIDVGQASNGNQSSDSTANSETSTSNNKSAADDVLSILNGPGTP
ncbi:MAG: hypothetical protein GC190_12040 [Alphaproteobacteria bacterium]|nr:hypothetical protein [Alphaproteobacteria bacterium]